MGKGTSLRYRCYTGHAFTSAVLLAEQNARIEETLWIALRMFEERRNLLATISKRRRSSASLAERASESEIHIARIRGMLRFSEKAASSKPND